MGFIPRPHTRHQVQNSNNINVGAETAIFIVIFSIQLILLAVAVYCLIKCAYRLPTWSIVLLTIALMTPGIGFLVAIAIIGYYFGAQCQKMS